MVDDHRRLSAVPDHGGGDGGDGYSISFFSVPRPPRKRCGLVVLFFLLFGCLNREKS